MKKISILIALILILGFASQSFASYHYNHIQFSILNKHHYAMYYTGGVSVKHKMYYTGILSVKHKLSYSMAKKMLEHPNREYPIKYEEILASYMYNYFYSSGSYSFWLKKAEIQNFFENVVPHFKITNKAISYGNKAISYGLSYSLNMYSYFMKLIKDNKKFHNYYVKYSPLFPLAKLDEQKILAAKRGKVLSAIAKEKALLGNNRYKAIQIMNNYCSRHNNCLASYNEINYTNNGRSIYTSSDFVLTVPLNAPDDFIITKTLFSTQLQNQLVFMLKQNGFSNASTINLTTAFVSYITQHSIVFKSNTKLFNKNILSTIQGLTNMVVTGDLKDFNELVNLFIKHFIKINK